MSRYISRSDGLTGKILYDNSLNSGENEKTYFPQKLNESQTEYKNRPKISVPISSAIVNRIVNILTFNTVITASDEVTQDIVDTQLKDLHLFEFLRDILVNTISTGGNLSVIRVLPDSKLELENFDNRWIWQSETGNGLRGYEFTTNKGVMSPVYSAEVKKEDITRVIIDSIAFGDTLHSIGFNPSVLTTNIDKYEQRIYGKSFIMRWYLLALEYNSIISQVSKSIKILQNIWITNITSPNPDSPLRLDPDRINFLGIDGTLEQSIKNLDLTEERNYLEILEHQISRAAQTPGELTGLRAIGKIPSGIALALMLQPLTELLGRYRSLFESTIEELVSKTVKMEYMLRGKVAPEFELEIETNEAIFPEDRERQLKEIVELHKSGLLPKEQAQQLLSPILDIDFKEDLNTITTSGIVSG